MRNSWPSLTEFKSFYSDRIGRLQFRILRRIFLPLFPNSAPATIIGIGYALPFLSIAKEGGHNIFHVLPTAASKPPLTLAKSHHSCVAYESLLPLPNHCADMVIVAHILEFTHHRETLLKEICRILKPQGRVLLLVPNRFSPWRFFRQRILTRGNFFSTHDLINLISAFPLVLESCQSALYAPPITKRWFIKTYRFWEIIGTSIPGYFGLALLAVLRQQEGQAITQTLHKKSQANRKFVQMPAAASSREH
jgi:SAM-dependent methyltransferase